MRASSNSTTTVMQAIVAAALLIAVRGEASQFMTFDREMQVSGCDLILTASVLSVSSSWSPEHSQIYSDAELAIDDVWKGAPESDRVVVRTLGGTVGSIGLEVDGAAQFAVGEHVLVLLKRSGDVFVPWGMKFGKYGILGVAGDLFAVGGLPPVVAEAQSYEVVTLPLADLRDEIAALVAGETR